MIDRTQLSSGNAFISSENTGPNVWKVITVMFAIGVVMITCFAFIPENRTAFGGPSYYRDFWTVAINLGTVTLIAGASCGVGMLLGFLFGIPRVVSQNIAPAVNAMRASTNGDTLAKQVRAARAIASNDNLVQISDWLTKIIVGVGLTQLYQIPHFINRIGVFLADSFRMSVDKSGNPTLDAVGRNEAIAVLIYFVVIGFIAAYIWTRLSFTKMLNDLEVGLDDDGADGASPNAA